MIESPDKNIDFLWQSFVKGNNKSFTLIYQQTMDGLLRYGLKFTHDRDLVHDCLQEVFIDLYVKKKKTGKTIKKLKPYLFVAVRNGIVKRLVKEKKSRSVSLEEINNALGFNVEYSHEQQFIKQEISKETQEKLKIAVTNLPARQKEIIYLKFEEGLDYVDIADVMKISVDSARKSMYRALLSLRKLLDSALF